jgi:predicted membrane channel-forming protein YqfA (hemolysin III family)
MVRRAGVLAGLLAGPFFLVSVGLNTWASIDYLHQLGWEFVGGEQVPWPSSLARGPYGWAQVATFVITGLLIVVLAIAVRDRLPQRRASSFAFILLALLGVALLLAAFRVDVPMLSGGDPNTWNGWVHAIAFLLIIATGVLAPLTVALAVGGDAGWRPIAVVSLAASALFIVFLSLPWGNATFLLAIVTLFGWIAALAARLATHRR